MEDTQFTITDEGLKLLRKNVLLYLAIAFILAVAVTFIIDLFKGTKDLTYYYLYIPLLALTFIFSSVIAIKKQVKILQSYTLKIKENAIIREQDNTPTISIPFAEIRSVKVTRNGNIIISGHNKYETIMVFKNITNYDKLLSYITNIEGVATSTNQQLVPKSKIPLIIASAILPLIIYSSYNKILVGISGLLFTVLMTYYTLETYKIKNIDNNLRRNLLGIPLIIIVTIAITIYKVFIL